MEVDENFVKEIIYIHFNCDDKVEKWYSKLANDCDKTNSDINKNIAFYLTKLVIENYDENSKVIRFLPIWKKKYVDKLLDIFKIEYSSMRKLLKIYKTIPNLFLNLLRDPKNMYILEKNEYVHIHIFCDEKVNYSYYYESRELYFKTVKLLKDCKFIENKNIVRIFNYTNRHLNEYYDVVYLVEYNHLLNKIIQKMKKCKINVCSCNNPHTNTNTIDVTSNCLEFIYKKISYNKRDKNIFECYNNYLYYDFFKHLSEIDSI